MCLHYNLWTRFLAFYCTPQKWHTPSVVQWNFSKVAVQVYRLRMVAYCDGLLENIPWASVLRLRYPRGWVGICLRNNGQSGLQWLFLRHFVDMRSQRGELCSVVSWNCTENSKVEDHLWKWLIGDWLLSFRQLQLLCRNDFQPWTLFLLSPSFIVMGRYGDGILWDVMVLPICILFSRRTVAWCFFRFRLRKTAALHGLNFARSYAGVFNGRTAIRWTVILIFLRIG